MTADQLIAVIAVSAPIVLAMAGFGWRLSAKLASIETIVSREMTHNGGSSTKDYARAGRDEAIAAKEQAALAKHLAENVDAKVDQLATRQSVIERRLRQVSDAVVGIQAVQTYKDALSHGAPGSVTTTTSSTTHDGTQQ